MTPDHKEPAPPGDPEEDPGGTEVPIRDPHVVGRNAVEDRPHESTLLSVPIDRRKHVEGQPQRRVEDHQGLTRQGSGGHVPQRFEPTLGAGQVVPVEHLHAVSRQGIGGGPAEFSDQWFEPPGGVPDEFSSGVEGQTRKALVEGGDRDRDGVVGSVGGVDRSVHSAHDTGHQIGAGGEEEFAVRAWADDLLEERVEWFRGQCILQRATSRNRQRGTGHEAVQDRIEQHSPPPKVTQLLSA